MKAPALLALLAIFGCSKEPPVHEPPRARLDPPPFTGGPYNWRHQLALSPEQEDRIWDLWMARQAELDALASWPEPGAFVAEIEERYEAAAEAFLDAGQRKRYRELVLETRLGLQRDSILIFRDER